MIRSFLSLLFLTVVVFGLVISDAQAKRFGGGRSIGVSRTNNSFLSSPAAKPLAQGPQANRWLGPLAGLALGGILASLFMGNGFGTGILTWLAIGAGIFLIMRWWRNRTQMASQSRYQAGHHQENAARDTSAYFSSANQYSAGASTAAPVYPAGFDADTFLRDAKVQFIRLQAAYDNKDLADIREFTTPEMYAEIHLQLQERGSEVNQTEVVQLNAELLDASAESEAMTNSAVQTMMASVRFGGSIKENSDQAANFSEVWHFRKDLISSRWIVAGVQQQ